MRIAARRVVALLLGIPLVAGPCATIHGRAEAQEQRVFERVDPNSAPAKLAIETYQGRIKDLPQLRIVPDLLGYVRMNVGIFQPASGAFLKQFTFNLADTLDVKLDIPGGSDIRTQLTAAPAPGLPGMTNWTGQVRDVQDSSVTITHFEGAVTGRITFPTLALKLQKARGDVYAVERINERSYPNEAHPQKRSDVDPIRPDEDARDLRTQCANDPGVKRVRLLVLHSDDAEKRVGSRADLTLRIGSIVGEANLALQNSGVRLELEVASISKISIARDPKSGVYLDNLSKTSGVQALRKQHRAHIVSLLDVFPQEYTYCGVGYIASMPPLVKEGYNVVDIGCASDKYSLIHEIGHNLGAGHNKGHGDGTFTYAYGMQWPNKFRSIMAYSCAAGSECDRIPRFTSPKLTFSGVTIGDSANADNARTLNELRCYVADWNIN